MATASTPATPCPAPIFDDKIKELEEALKKQDQSDAKSQLAAITKINDETDSVLGKYKKDYDGLVFAENESAHYQQTRLDSIKLSEEEKATIKRIVDCTPTEQVLEAAWIKARDLLPNLQKLVLEAQNAAADAERKYKAALDYKANQKALDDLRAQSSKEFEAQNPRGTYFLLFYEMYPKLKPPLPPEGPGRCIDPPPDFKCYLQLNGDAHFKALEALRVAKINLDQATADAQKKKKEFDDAKAKRGENILKQIAEEPFPKPPDETTSSPTGPEGSGERSSGESQA